jgi:hypothetical protein
MGYTDKGKGKGQWGLWRWVEDGNTKGGGKAKGKGKSKGKGKGITRESKKSTSYFFEDYPHLAKGDPVVKCKNPICFGCCRFGHNPPTTCYECGQAFDYSRFHGEPEAAPNKEAARPARDSSAGSSRSNKDEKEHHKTQGDVLYNSLVGAQMSEADAIKNAKTAFPKWSKEHVLIDSATTIANTGNDIKRATQVHTNLKIKLNAQQIKYTRISKELEDCEAVGVALVLKIKEAKEEIAKHERFLVTNIGISKVMHQKHTAYGGDEDSTRILTSLETFILTSATGEQAKCAASSDLMDGFSHRTAYCDR